MVDRRIGVKEEGINGFPIPTMGVGTGIGVASISAGVGVGVGEASIGAVVGIGVSAIVGEGVDGERTLGGKVGGLGGGDRRGLGGSHGAVGVGHEVLGGGRGHASEENLE